MSTVIQEGYLISNHAGFCNPNATVIGNSKNIYRKSAIIEELRADGSVKLTNDEIIENVDLIVLCTGYALSFSFLDVPGL